MYSIYSEVYRLMEQSPDGDLSLCLDEEGNEIFSDNYHTIEKEKITCENNQYYDNPLVIVRETQVIVG